MSKMLISKGKMPSRNLKRRDDRVNVLYAQISFILCICILGLLGVQYFERISSERNIHLDFRHPSFSRLLKGHYRREATSWADILRTQNNSTATLVGVLSSNNSKAVMSEFDAVSAVEGNLSSKKPAAVPTIPARKHQPICFTYHNATCSLASCSGEPPSSHLRGLVKEIPPPWLSEPNASRPRGTCQACPVYSRHCAVSTAHRFIYIHVMKSAGSSAHRFLQSALCEPTGEEDQFNCTAPQLVFAECDRAAANHPGFFKWGLVRHPFHRAVSAWAMASSALEDGGAPLPFNEWAEDPSRMKTQAWEMHWWPQSAFLIDAAGCPIYDFVGTLGPGLARDLEYILTRIDSQLLWEHYRNGGFPHAYRSADGVRHEALANLSDAAAGHLARRYRDDFDHFGFGAADWREAYY